jgi:hypothetical protein
MIYFLHAVLLCSWQIEAEEGDQEAAAGKAQAAIASHDCC